MRQVVVVAICTLFASSVAHAEERSDEWQETYREAVEAFQRGEYDAAAKLFGQTHAIRSDPLLLYNRSYALGRAGRFSQAIEVATLAELGGLDASHHAKNGARSFGYRVRLTSTTIVDAEVEGAVSRGSNGDVESPPTRRDAFFWLAGSSAIIAVGTGLTTLILDRQIAARAEDLEVARRENDAAKYAGRLERIESLQRVARPLFVVSAVSTAAALAFGVTWLIRRPGAEKTASWYIAPSGTGASAILLF